MSNNYRNLFLLSPTKTTPTTTAARLRQTSNTSAENNNCVQVSSQRLAVPRGDAEYQQQQQQANYCQSQICRNEGGQVKQSGRFAEQLGANCNAERQSSSQTESGAERRQWSARQEVTRGEHYIWQPNSGAQFECMASGAKQQQQQQQRQRSRQQHQSKQLNNLQAKHSFQYKNNNNNNNNNNNIDTSNSQYEENDGTCLPVNQSELRQTNSFSGAEHFHLQQELNPLTEQMAKLLSKNGERGASGSSQSGGSHIDGDEIDDYQYANQLRRSQFNQFSSQQRPTPEEHQLRSAKTSLGQQQQQQCSSLGQHSRANDCSTTLGYESIPSPNQQVVGGQRFGNKNATTKQLNSGKGEQQQQQQRSIHVNFNRRPSQLNASDDENESETRKKKYLTAKYGQQQMNLIKKRLKIETWLHERLQELAKQSKTITPDELDDIDIDLDQLLDLENDSRRRSWLRELLQPLSDLPTESIALFVDEVLEQSKLL